MSPQFIIKGVKIKLQLAEVSNGIGEGLLWSFVGWNSVLLYPMEADCFES